MLQLATRQASALRQNSRERERDGKCHPCPQLKKAHEGVINQISTASYDVERILELWGSYLFAQCLWAHLVSFFEGWTGSPSVLDFLGSLVLS